MSGFGPLEQNLPLLCAKQEDNVLLQVELATAIPVVELLGKDCNVASTVRSMISVSEKLAQTLTTSPSIT